MSRIVAYDKSNLAPQGKSIAFELNPETVFSWKDYCETTVDELLCGNGTVKSKTTIMEIGNVFVCLFSLAVDFLEILLG